MYGGGLDRLPAYSVILAGAIAFPSAANWEACSTDNVTRLQPDVLEVVEHVRARINVPEAQTLERVAGPRDSQVEQVQLLGKGLLYDEQLFAPACVAR